MHDKKYKRQQQQQQPILTTEQELTAKRDQHVSDSTDTEIAIQLAEYREKKATETRINKRNKTREQEGSLKRQQNKMQEIHNS